MTQEQVLSEEVLRLQNEEQRALNAILRISLEELPLAQQCERILDLLLSLSWLPIEPKGGIFLTDPSSEALLLHTQRGLDPELLSACARVPFGRCLCGRAAASGETQFASCLDRRHEIGFDGMGAHGHYNIPILSGQGVLGVIVVYLSEGHTRRESEVAFLESVAHSLAALIERHRTRESLEASQARLAETQRIAHLGGWEWGEGQAGMQVSEEVYRIFGVEPGEVLTLDVLLSHVHPEDRQMVRESMVRAVSVDGGIGLDYRLLRPDGTEAIVHSRMEMTTDSLGYVRLYGTVQDITERKQMEERLRQSATVFENTTEGVMITDVERRIVAVNRAFTEITGYGQEELTGQSSAILDSGRHDAQFYEAMWRTIRDEGRWQGEIWSRRENGDIYPEWLNISEVRNGSGRVTHYVAVFSDISAMKESEARLDHIAHHDPLTNLPNRLLLHARMEQALAKARRSNTLMAVMFLDLDYFKKINDTMGHPIGDQLLQEVAARLRNCVREVDTVSRLGGDEFTILLEELHEARAVGAVAQKIITELGERYLIREHEVFVTCSIGISLFPGDGDDITTLLKNADTALYRAKEQGRNNYQYYTLELTIRAMERMAMENNLRHALERNELVVYYQPQVDLFSGRIIGMEALLRWQHPEMGLIAPASFIPLAEELGLIIPIGEWVLRTACLRLKAWQEEGLDIIRMAVNLSSRQFNQPDLAEVVIAILEETGIDPHCLELELTERILMEDAERAIGVLNRLKAVGVQFSIDDFGTGYSSLSYLKQFPIDRIKIDQSFVNNVTSVPEDAAVTQAVISLSHSMNIKAVAEGVETIEQHEFLRSRQCDELQGFYFSHPLPEEEIGALLRNGIDLEGLRREVIKQDRVLLLVDDEKPILNALERALRPEGFHILSSTDPFEALDMLATHPVDVIVTDQRMPGMSGIELLRRVRQLHPEVVRIMLTAHADTQVTAAAINEGAVFKFIFKPWSDEDLREVLREAFALRVRNGRPQRATESEESG
jgi:diguanylate cyclase (GGDEF)-like protein/PAS domain S-box-containing protein